MQLSLVLTKLYPNIIWGPQSTDCVIIDGNIMVWDTVKLGPQPTSTQLEAAWPAAQLQALQAAQNTLLNTSCIAVITGGFLSSALGTAHTYPSTMTDQHNLSGSVLASLLPNLPSTWTTPFWVMGSSGAWSFAPHTAAQIQQAGLDGKEWVTAQQGKLQSLKAQVAAADLSTVTSIVW